MLAVSRLEQTTIQDSTIMQILNGIEYFNTQNNHHRRDLEQNSRCIYIIINCHQNLSLKYLSFNRDTIFDHFFEKVRCHYYFRIFQNESSIYDASISPGKNMFLKQVQNQSPSPYHVCKLKTSINFFDTASIKIEIKNQFSNF